MNATIYRKTNPMPDAAKSKMVMALEKFCEQYSDDPNLFPVGRDTVVSENNQGAIISEHPECTSDDLEQIFVADKLRGIDQCQS